MPPERERVPLTGIHINLASREVVFEAGERVVGKLTFGAKQVVFEAGTVTPAALPAEEPHPEDQDEAQVAKEKERTTTLSGRLKGKVREGRPDARGNPTAWGRFAAHEEDRDDAHLFSTTFHRHSAKVALGLRPDDAITVEGYPHVNDDPARMDTLSVINILSYPEKTERPKL